MHLFRIFRLLFIPPPLQRGSESAAVGGAEGTAPCGAPQVNAHQGAEGEDSSPVKTKQEPVGAAEGGPPLSPVHWRAGGSGDASNGSSLSPSAVHIAAVLLLTEKQPLAWGTTTSKENGAEWTAPIAWLQASKVSLCKCARMLVCVCVYACVTVR